MKRGDVLRGREGGTLGAGEGGEGELLKLRMGRCLGGAKLESLLGKRGSSKKKLMTTTMTTAVFCFGMFVFFLVGI